MGGDAGDTPFLLYRKYNPSEFEEDGCGEENLRDDFGELREYEREYRYHSTEARLWVDDKLAGTAKSVLVEGTSTANGLLHKAADRVSHELQVVALTFCDKHGNPRVESLKHANVSAADGFLYNRQFGMNQQYRPYPYVAASALTSLLCETKLSGNFTSLCARGRGERKRLNDISGDKDFCFVEEGSKHLQRCNELSKIDATPFLRAGFQQATNTLVGENTYQFFANPASIRASSDDKDISIVDRSFLEHVVDTDSRVLVHQSG
jgi:hypothetical protein